MLNNYIDDWNEARQHATITDERCDENGVVEFQKASIEFLGTTIEMRIQRVPEDNDVDSPEPKEPKYSATLFVPKTGAIVESLVETPWPMTEFIITLMEAVDPDSKKKASEALAKRQATVEEFIQSKVNYWNEQIAASSYSDVEKELILDHANTVLKTPLFGQADMFIEVVTKYYDQLMDETPIERKNAGTTNQMILIFDTLCDACIKQAYFNDGVFIISRKSMDYGITDTSHDADKPAYIMEMKTLLRQIYADCGHRPSMFSFVAHGLCKLYSTHMDEDLNYHIARVRAKIEQRTKFKKSREQHYRTQQTRITNNNAFANALLFATPIKSK